VTEQYKLIAGMAWNRSGIGKSSVGDLPITSRFSNPDSVAIPRDFGHLAGKRRLSFLVLSTRLRPVEVKVG
jgi:hypothetical protein